MPSKQIVKKSRRKSYEDRTGMNSRASVITANAMFGKRPTFHEDADGNQIRDWQRSELMTFTNAEIASCLANRVAVEPNEMLGTVPPSAIKYAVTRGWLLPNESKTLYRVTLKGAIDLNLPMTFKGINGGRKIPFA